jgi:unsaturated pyranuronate lyase
VREVSAFAELGSIEPREVWERILARSVHGDRMTLGVVELEPGAHAREHSHDHEQLGLVLQGTIEFRIGDDRRTLGPGATYVIPSNVPHEAIAGPEGTVVVDVFAPVRTEWRDLAPSEQRAPRWPGSTSSGRRRFCAAPGRGRFPLPKAVPRTRGCSRHVAAPACLWLRATSRLGASPPTRPLSGSCPRGTATPSLRQPSASSDTVNRPG